MESNNWRPPPQGDAQQPPPPADGGGDWRSQLQPDSRQRIVNKIMETLKRHLPFHGQDGLQELKQIAIRFEEKIYSAATSQSDYLRKISLKMLTMESKSQNTLPNAVPSNSAGVSRNPQDLAASQNTQSQVLMQGQSVPPQMMPNQSQPRQQILSQGTQSNITSGGNQTAAGLPTTIPTTSLQQNPIPNVAQNPNLQNISGISQSSMGNTMNQGMSSNMFSIAQRQLQARQQQSQNTQQYMYQQQLQHQIMKQKLQQQNTQQPLAQTQVQQQQHAQKSMMQISSGMQLPMITGQQPNQQQSSIQQPNQSVLQQHQQSVIRQQQPQVLGTQPNAGNIQQSQLIGQQSNSGNMLQNQLIGQQPNSGNMQQSQLISQQPNSGNMHQNQLIGQLPNSGNVQQSQLISQQQNAGSMHQNQLIGQQQNSGNMQQSQLTGQQSNISDMQQQQQQQRLPGQQNNVPNMPPQQTTSQQNMKQQQFNLQNMHQQQLGQQSHVGGQQLVQSGNASMQTNQHSLHMTQQSKLPMQQQTQNAGSILPGGGQQQQSQSQSQSQQQLMSQLQSQPTQVQQQLGMQQQQPNYLQHNMQQRIQNMNPMPQQQSLIDQQKLFQAQRATPEGPSTSLDSTAQTGSVNAGDWQEEVYQKIKSMNDMYYADLNEMHQKISMKLQQHDSLPQQPKIEQIEKLRVLKNMLERLMQILQITKNNILPSHREKLLSFEKQIVNILNSNRPRKPVPSLQQAQIIPPQLHSIQQPHPQIPQTQSHDGGMNPQLQSMNLSGSVTNMQQNSMPGLQHGSVSSLSGIKSSQQNIPGSLQPSSNLDPGQVNATSSMQSQSGVSLLHPNINNAHPNSNMLQNQHLKQQQEQQLKQHIQSKQMHQQQFLQKQQLLQQQQLHQQAKQQHASQMQANQMPQLHPLNDVNEKMRQLRSGAFPQHHSAAQRFMNQQLKPGTSFPVPSPQLLNAGSPQMTQHSSPQIDQYNLPSSASVLKSGTPLQSANSPFAPSPSTPVAPSPMPGDNEKPAFSSLSNAANVGHQQTNGTAQSMSIGTPGISLSPLFECAGAAGADGTHGNTPAVSGKSSVTEQPIERLLRAVKSISPKALSAAVSDISSVVSMVDRIAGSAPGNGSRATVGEDLVAMTKCRMQARNFLTQDGGSVAKKMKRYTSAMPLIVGASVGSMNDSLKRRNGPDTPELESTATSSVKKARIEVKHALVEELREINNRFIDTVFDISNEVMDPSMAAPTGGGGEGTIVKCSYNAITLSPCLRLQLMSAQMSPIQPLKFLVPANYPNCSPILLDKVPVGTGDEPEDLSVKAKSRFSISLRSLSQPMSLKYIAKTWDDCARAVLCEYAQPYGGGTFSSKYGTWENCLSAA